MNEEYVGQQIVGIDLHRHRSVLVRMTESGERLGGVRINNDPYAFASVMAEAGVHPEVVLEATYGGCLRSRSPCSARAGRPATVSPSR